MKKEDTLYISIVSHGHLEYIRKNFSGFPKRVEETDIELMILDNIGSTALQKWCEKEGVHYHHDGRTRGFGANHNLAFKLFAPKPDERFLVCNPDIRIDREQFARMVTNSRGCDIYAPVIYFDKAQNRLDNPDKTFPGLLNFAISFVTQKRLHYGTRMRTTEPGWISGAFMLFRAAVYAQLGGFDESYFMYCEDIDICYRAKEAGYRITLDHSCHIEHHAQMDSRNIFSKHSWWHIRSAFRYALKHKKIAEFKHVRMQRQKPGGTRER